MRILTLFLLLSFSMVSAQQNNNVLEGLEPCMNIKHSQDIVPCLVELTLTRKKEYEAGFEAYLQSINAPEERPYNKAALIRLANRAKKSWDSYTENECLAESSLYEKDTYGYDATHKTCLIDHYNQRIKYYKEKTF